MELFFDLFEGDFTNLDLLLGGAGGEKGRGDLEGEVVDDGQLVELGDVVVELGDVLGPPRTEAVEQGLTQIRAP